MLWYSLEAPHRGASNEYPQYMFSSRNQRYQHFSAEKSTLICCYAQEFVVHIKNFAAKAIQNELSEDPDQTA